MSKDQKVATGSCAQQESDNADPQPAATRNANPAAYRDSAEIFNGLREVVIKHNGAEYRLRITSSGKLILTK
jgi:hemin uptake protein HemP